MSAIKEFFHDEICEMQNGEELHIDEAYILTKLQNLNK